MTKVLQDIIAQRWKQMDAASEARRYSTTEEE